MSRAFIKLFVTPGNEWQAAGAHRGRQAGVCRVEMYTNHCRRTAHNRHERSTIARSSVRACCIVIGSESSFGAGIVLLKRGNVVPTLYPQTEQPCRASRFHSARQYTLPHLICADSELLNAGSDWYAHRYRTTEPSRSVLCAGGDHYRVRERRVHRAWPAPVSNGFFIDNNSRFAQRAYFEACILNNGQIAVPRFDG